MEELKIKLKQIKKVVDGHIREGVVSYETDSYSILIEIADILEINIKDYEFF